MKKQLIYQIIRKLADRTLPASQRDIVLRWLIGPQDTSEKEETMFRLWNDTNGTEVSDESAKRALQNVKEKLNINKLRTKHIQWFQVATKYAAILLYLRNAAFLRLKNLSLTYDFKHKLLKSAKWLSTCQVSLTGSNLFTISGVSDYWDPETTNTNGGYPTSRIYSLGVTLGF